MQIDPHAQPTTSNHTNRKSRLSSRKHSQRDRRGGTYIIVLGSALIVSTLGMMAILQQRIQRKGFEAAADMEQARLNIESALRLGLLDIQQDPSWRATYAANDGQVLADTSAEYGSVALQALDPVDDDLDDDEHDPVVLRATADMNDTKQLGEVLLYPTTVPPDVLWKGVVAGDDVIANGGTIRSERPISCDVSSLISSSMYADVEAVGLGGSTYHGDQTLVLNKHRPGMPDMNALVSEYASRGTPISYFSLALPPQLITNPGMEYGYSEGEGNSATDWFSPPNPPEWATCDVEQEDEMKINGSYSLRVSNRSAPSAGPIHYCTDWVKPNTSYRVTAYVHISNGLLGLDPQKIRFAWYVKAEDGSSQWQYSSEKDTGGLLDSGGWYLIDNIMIAGSWSGDVESSHIKIETDSGTKDFYVDDFTIQEVDGRFLYRQVLSPNSNPFGSPNPEGIYVIDCQGERLVIERCRIVGTLVILNPGPGSTIDGPISWEPARPGYPALIVGATSPYDTANMRLAYTRQDLSEPLNSTNFNPTGTPHAAVDEDTDQDDVLPSEIRGWIYAGGTLTFRNTPTVHGVVLAGEDIDFGGEPTIHWDPAPIYHPPPGLEGTLELRAREGARQKAVQPPAAPIAG